MTDNASKIVLGTLSLSPEFMESSDELDSSLFTRGRERELFEFMSSEWAESRPEKFDVGKALNKLGNNDSGWATWFGELSDYALLAKIKTSEDFRAMVGQLVKRNIEKRIIKKLCEYQTTGDFVEAFAEIKPLILKHEVAGDRDKKLAEDVRSWVNAATGEFRLPQLYSELSVVSENSKAAVRQVLARMAKEGLVDHAGKDYGRYRKVGKLADPIDLMSVVSAPLDIYLPLGLGELVKVYPKNILIFAGESSRGKTALALDFVKHNMDKHEVRYFFKEGGPEELRSRLEPHTDIPMESWKMLAFEHDGYVADAIAGDGDALYVYDYLHCGEQAYYEIDKMFNISQTIGIVGSNAILDFMDN